MDVSFTKSLSAMPGNSNGYRYVIPTYVYLFLALKTNENYNMYTLVLFHAHGRSFDRFN